MLAVQLLHNLTMRLKTKLLLASSAIVLVVLGLSEWIAYRQMNQFLRGHEMRMASEMNHGAVLADLRQGRQALLLRLAALHTFQLCSFMLACGPSVPPKRCTEPSGRVSVRLPWTRRCSSCSVVRAAAGALRGSAKPAGCRVAVVLFM